MQLSVPARAMLGILIGLAAFTADAEPVPLGELVTEVENGFTTFFGNEVHIVESARRLFWSLATISLVWTMGLQLVRQDIGEAMMEFLRFTVVTGTFYWLLVNATARAGGDGFVQSIVDSFYQMTNRDDSGAAFRAGGNDAVMRGLNIFLKVIEDTSSGDDGERILSGLMGVMILVALTLLGAQFLLALIMAWLLGYGGIFLLGFGGARWTSQIAINYYKHVVALGIAILALNIIGSVSQNVFGRVSPAFGVRTELTYGDLGTILAVSVLMLVLGLRVPQLLYTLVTGSSLGLFAGTAGMVGSAIATGGGAAITSASGRVRAGEGGGGPSGTTASVARSTSAIEAIERSAVSASGMADPFHLAGGLDPFGVPRGQDAQRAGGGGSVFGGTSGPAATAATVLPGAKASGEGSVSAGPARAVSETAGSVATSIVEESAVLPAESRGGDAIGTRGAASLPNVASANGDDAAPRPDYLAEMSAITAARADSPTYAPGANEADPAREYLHEDAATRANPLTDTASPDIAHAEPTAADASMIMSSAEVIDAHIGASSRQATSLSSLSSDDARHAFAAFPDDDSTMAATGSRNTRATSTQAASKVDDYPIDEMARAHATLHEDEHVRQQASATPTAADAQIPMSHPPQETDQSASVMEENVSITSIRHESAQVASDVDNHESDTEAVSTSYRAEYSAQQPQTEDAPIGLTPPDTSSSGTTRGLSRATDAAGRPPEGTSSSAADDETDSQIER